MGYTTDFSGKFKFNKKLDEETRVFLTKFSETRRMKRKLPAKYGVEGEFYVDGGGLYGQDHEPSITNYNEPPRTQPGLWCQWIPSEDGKFLEWNGAEKFYNYIAWLKYIIREFFIPWGIKANGEIEWQGEDRDDIGKIKVKDNEIFVYDGQITFPDEDEE